MTPEEITEKFREHRISEQKLLLEIMVAARAVVAVLLDAGRAHSAKALQELLFKFDANKQEFERCIRVNPDAAMAAALAALRRAAGDR